MSELKKVHERAMRFADLAVMARAQGRESEALKHLREAYQHEAMASDLVADDLELEPTRAILHRSAAALALDCGLIAEAQERIARGLEGNPPRDIAAELRDLGRRADSMQSARRSRDVTLNRLRAVLEHVGIACGVFLIMGLPVVLLQWLIAALNASGELNRSLSTVLSVVKSAILFMDIALLALNLGRAAWLGIRSPDRLRQTDRTSFKRRLGDEIASGLSPLTNILTLRFFSGRALDSVRARRMALRTLIGFLSLSVILGILQFVAIRTSALELELVDGTALHNRILPGGAHTFRIVLESGDFLHAIVDQLGADVEVTLSDPNDATLLDVDSPNGNRGAEKIWFRADRSGTYRLRIMCESDCGEYELTIPEIAHDPTSEDISAAQAAAVFDQAESIRRAGTPAQQEEALVLYDQAIALWRELGEREQEILTLRRKGQALHDASRLAEAGEAFERGAELARSAMLTDYERMLWTDAGEVCQERDQLDRALGMFQLAAELARQTENVGGLSRALSDKGTIYDRLGRSEKALEAYDAALALNVDDRRHAIALLNKGTALSRIGRYPEARDNLTKALSRFQALGELGWEVEALTQLGWLDYLNEDYEKALRQYDLAIQEWEKTGPQGRLVWVLDRKATAHAKLGEFETALELYNQFLSLLPAEAATDRANTLANIGELFLDRGNPDEAMRFCLQALQLLNLQARDPHAEIHTHYLYSRALAEKGDLKGALDHMGRAIEEVSAVRIDIDRPAMRMSFASSRNIYQSYYLDLLMRLDLQDPSGNYGVLALEAVEAARARELTERLADAQQHSREEEGSQLLQREADLRRRIEHLVGSQAELSQTTAVAVRSLLAELDEVDGELMQGPVAAAASDADVADGEPVRRMTAAMIQQLLDADTHLLVYASGDDASYVWTVSRSHIRSHRLASRETIKQAVSQYYDLIGTGYRAGAEIQLKLAAAEVSRLVLAPVREELDAKRLVFDADGALSYLPFAALPRSPDNASDLLIDRSEIITIPSAATLARLRTASGPSQGPVRVAVLADPVFYPQSGSRSSAEERLPEAASRALRESAADLGVQRLRPLPYSRKEAEAIASLVPGDRIHAAVGYDADRRWVLSGGLRGYNIIHIATHGFLDSQFPELSGLVLSLYDQQGNSIDGYLRTYELYGLDLKSADLVVLSACQTALGKQIEGEGMVGLTRGFLYAGAKHLLISLWDVDDESTAVLMREFYTHLLRDGQEPAAALRSAQLALRQDPRWKDPFHWAAFIAQGDWR